MSGRLLAITGGHRFDGAAFEAMLQDVAGQLGWEWAHETQPDAQRWLQPEHAGTWDAIVLYDIAGLALARGAEPLAATPSPAVQAGVRGLLDAGQGIVALHHALAGWPVWDEWADLLGGRFLYAPGTLHGIDVPASGYRMDSYRVEPVDHGHPVCDGVEGFDVDDELYLCPVFEGDVTPLLQTRADMTPASMIDTYREVRFGERVAAPSQPSSQLLGWARSQASSRVVYILPGHGPTTMANAMYRRLLANSCRWVGRRT